MKIAVDVMGGDFAPREVVAGACQWAQKPGCEVILVGDRDSIEKELDDSCDLQQVGIVHTSEVIDMEESVLALRKKKDASIVVATRMVAEKKADAVLSCGSTAAQMASALFILGRLENIDRPPVVTAIPGPGGRSTLLIDAGANVDCKPRQLLQFAVLGKAYSESVLGKNNPTIGLLNNGTEATKGNAVAVEAYSLLKAEPSLNFSGNIEGRDLFVGSGCDIVVCDGFTGNIVLKSLEGFGMFLAQTLSREIGHAPQTLRQFDYSNVGGAPLLGVEGVSIVCHGSSRREAVFNGLQTAAGCVASDMVNKQKEALQRIVVNQE